MLKDKEIVAFTALWNQTNYKQYIVKKYHFPLNILKGLSFITSRIGYIDFPNENETFPFHHLSFLLVKDNDINLYKTFIYKICKKEKDKSLLEIEPVELRETIVRAFASINSNTRKGAREYNEMYGSNPKEEMAVFAYSIDYTEQFGKRRGYAAVYWAYSQRSFPISSVD